MGMENMVGAKVTVSNPSPVLNLAIKSCAVAMDSSSGSSSSGSLELEEPSPSSWEEEELEELPSLEEEGLGSRLEHAVDVYKRQAQKRPASPSAPA